MSEWDLYSSYEPEVRSATRWACRHYCINEQDAGDFEADLICHLASHAGAVLRRIDLAERPAAYISKVVRRFAIGWLRQRCGRWRPSARARRLGECAIELERLIARDGVSPSEAVNVVFLKPGCSMSRAGLELYARQLRPTRPTMESCDFSDRPAQWGSPDAELLATESVRALRRVHRTFLGAIADLQPTDRLLLALRWGRKLTMEQIGAAFGEPGDRVQKRHERLLRRLRTRLEACGVARGDLAAVEQLRGRMGKVFECVLADLEPGGRQTDRDCALGGGLVSPVVVLIALN